MKHLPKYNANIFMHCIMLLLIVTCSCSDEDLPIQFNLKIRIEPLAHSPTYVLISDKFGTVLQSAKISDAREPIDFIISVPDSSAKFMLTTIDAYPHFCMFKSYSELGPGTYKIGENSVPYKEVVGNHTLIVTTDGTAFRSSSAYGKGLESVFVSNQHNYFSIKTFHFEAPTELTFVTSPLTQVLYKKVTNLPLNDTTTIAVSEFKPMENVVEVSLENYFGGRYFIYEIPNGDYKKRLPMYDHFTPYGDRENLKIYYPDELAPEVTTEISLFQEDDSGDFYSYTGARPPQAFKTIKPTISALETLTNTVKLQATSLCDVIEIQAYEYIVELPEYYEYQWSLFVPGKDYSEFIIPSIPADILDDEFFPRDHIFKFNKVLFFEYSGIGSYGDYISTHLIRNEAFAVNSKEIIRATRLAPD